MTRRLAVLAGRVLRGRFGDSGRPWKWTHALTYRCNQRCGRCLIWAREASPELGTADLERLYAASGRLASWIDLTGGEIFLRPDLGEIVEIILRLCPNLAFLHFPTNGSFPGETEALCRRIRARGGPRPVVTVSLDGPEELHDRVRNAPGSWKSSVETYQRVQASGADAFFGMTLGRTNIGLVEPTLAGLRTRVPDCGPRDLHVNLFHHSSHYYGNAGVKEKLDVSAAGALRGIMEKRGLPRDGAALLERLYLDRAGRYLAEGRIPSACRAGDASCFIDPSGTVYPCTIWDRPIARLGDARWDLGAVWQGSARREVRGQARAGSCPGCWTPCEAFPALLSGGAGRGPR